MGGHVFIQNSGRRNSPEGVSIFVNEPAIDFVTTDSTHASCFRLTEAMSGDQSRVIIRENLDGAIGEITRPFKGSASRTEHVVHRNVPVIIAPLAVATAVTGCLVKR